MLHSIHQTWKLKQVGDSPCICKCLSHEICNFWNTAINCSQQIWKSQYFNHMDFQEDCEWLQQFQILQGIWPRCLPNEICIFRNTEIHIIFNHTDFQGVAEWLQQFQILQGIRPGRCQQGCCCQGRTWFGIMFIIHDWKSKYVSARRMMLIVFRNYLWKRFLKGEAKNLVFVPLLPPLVPPLLPPLHGLNTW